MNWEKRFKDQIKEEKAIKRANTMAKYYRIIERNEKKIYFSIMCAFVFSIFEILFMVRVVEEYWEIPVVIVFGIIVTVLLSTFFIMIYINLKRKKDG